jgi:hypothetical protein
MSKRLVGGLASVGLLLASSAAMAETKATADVNVSGGYATNPYGSGSQDTGSATVNAAFTPSIIMTSPTGSLSLRGRVSHTEYTKRYSSSTDYNVTASAAQQLSSLMSIRASAGFNSQFRNLLDPILDPGVIQPENPDDPVIVDPTANLEQRTESFFGSAGLNVTLSPRDTLSVFGQASDVEYSGLSTLSRDHTSYGGGLSYSRAVGANTSVGLSFNASRADYKDGRLGDSTQFSPAAIFNTKLAPRLSLNVSAGVTFSEVSLLVGSTKHTSLSGSIGLCNVGDRSSLCANASQSVRPSAIGGTSTVTSVGANYRYELDPKSRIGAYVSYARSNSLVDLGNRKTSYGRGGVNYSRDLTQRLGATASVSYGKSFGSDFSSGIARSGNFYGTVGIRYRLGTL